MVYYIISYFLYGDIFGKIFGMFFKLIKVEQMIGEVWDYIFFCIDSVEIDIFKEDFVVMRREFLYWYFMNLCGLGKVRNIWQVVFYDS